MTEKVAVGAVFFSERLTIFSRRSTSAGPMVRRAYRLVFSLLLHVDGMIGCRCAFFCVPFRRGWSRYCVAAFAAWVAAGSSFL